MEADEGTFSKRDRVLAESFHICGMHVGVISPCDCFQVKDERGTHLECFRSA